jgi:hypothetical protein
MHHTYLWNIFNNFTVISMYLIWEIQIEKKIKTEKKSLVKCLSSVTHLKITCTPNSFK